MLRSVHVNGRRGGAVALCGTHSKKVVGLSLTRGLSVRSFRALPVHAWALPRPTYVSSSQLWRCGPPSRGKKKRTTSSFAGCTTPKLSTEQVTQDGKSSIQLLFKIIKLKKKQTPFGGFSHSTAGNVNNSDTQHFHKRSQATKNTLD